MTTSKVAVVTGGTSGIGLATARLLVAQGAKVVIAGRDAERGDRAARELGESSSYVQTDVSKAPDARAMVEEAMKRWGRLDWAVNAAAVVGQPALLADIAEHDWDQTLDVDLKGVWLSMKNELHALVRSGGGAIVNVSSVNGLSGTPTASAYCAAKHAVHGLSKTAAMEYAAHRVRVNIVCPGAHLTPMLEGVIEKVSPGEPERGEALFASKIPIGWVAEPVECARAIVWLLSDAAAYITGAVLTVDGGLSLGAA